MHVPQHPDEEPYRAASQACRTWTTPPSTTREALPEYTTGKLRDIVDLLRLLVSLGHGDHGIVHRAGVVEAQSRPMSTMSFSESALHRACTRGFAEDVRQLYRPGADATEEALHIVCRNGRPDIASLLIDRGADVNAADAGKKSTPLHVACTNGHVSVVCVLMDRGAAISATDRSGWTPLHEACFRGRLEIARLLVDRGADVRCANACGNTPLHLACCTGRVSTALFLVERGADVSAANQQLITPLHFACRGYAEAAKMLIEHGANIHAETMDGETPLHDACCVGEDTDAIAQALLAAGARVSKKNAFGTTPLDMAIRSRKRQVVELLSALGAKRGKNG